jgi:DNA repair protein RecN (Recombination protein N)
MLRALSIRDIVLIEKLDVDLSGGLTVLTGETGAGKSILLDALGLALGARGNASLVRTSAQQGVVTAAFDLPASHDVYALLQDHGISPDDSLVIRRVQTAAGQSKAFINDQPVSVNLLRRVGTKLVEIHGQHDDRALMEAGEHRRLLDAFGELQDDVTAVEQAHGAMVAARDELEAHRQLIARAETERAYLEHVGQELRDLAPQPGEEEQLAGRRQMMMHAEQFAESINDAFAALKGDDALDVRVSSALRKLERRREQAGGVLDEVCAALDRVLAEVGEAQVVLNEALGKLKYDPAELETTEERLFALKAAARKHNVPVDALAALAEKFDADLQAIADGSRKLDELTAVAEITRKAFMERAEALSTKRIVAAAHLDTAVARELAPLKLEHARFRTSLASDPLKSSASGIDRVEFLVAANPGTAPAPLAKVASGGELSRFLLALKVVLAARGSAPTLIFDEIDTGVGGAVADAMGQRLAQLSGGLQVVAVTHSPQVAARANQHLLISKMESVGDGDGRMVTRVAGLGSESRREEIARMLSASEVTSEARAQAERLLAGTG